MKFKLDENLGNRCLRKLIEAGHDAETVLQERLSGASDALISEVCAREARCLLTLDVDFADVWRFPPAKHAGIIVFRPSHRVSSNSVEAMLDSVLLMLRDEEITGRLWIVEAGRIRVYDGPRRD